MGPPPFSDGNVAAVDALDGEDWLQWGRRLSATEMSNGIVLLFRNIPLQWGRRLSATEIPLPIGYIFITYTLQWGRRLSATEIFGSVLHDNGSF